MRQHRTGDVQLLRARPCDWKSTAAPAVAAAPGRWSGTAAPAWHRIVTVAVALRRIERRMGIVDVHARQPRGVRHALLAHEFDGALRAPGGLVQLRRHPGGIARQLAEHRAAIAHPVGVVMALRPVVARRVAVTPVAVAVVRARFDAAVGAGQMQLADQPAVVAGIRQQPGDQRKAVHETVISVARVVAGAGVGAGQEAGTAGRAYGTLAVGVGERGPDRHNVSSRGVETCALPCAPSVS